MRIRALFSKHTRYASVYNPIISVRDRDERIIIIIICNTDIKKILRL